MNLFHNRARYRVRQTTEKDIWTRWWSDHIWQRYALSLVCVGLTSLIGTFTQRYLSSVNLLMLYLLNVVLVALYLGRGPSILASVVGILAFDFLFVPPHRTLAFTDAGYLLTFIVHLVVGLVISTMTSQAREQALSARQREAETAALYALSRDLAVIEDVEAIIQAIVTHTGETFNRTVVVLLPDEESPQTLIAHPECPEFVLDDLEMSAAAQVFNSGASAGCGTNMFPNAQAYYLPLKTARGMVGVLGVKADRSAEPLTANERRLLETFASQSALALERAQLAKATHQLQVLQVTERLQSALLSSISHDLRTPLVTITGALSTLDEDEAILDDATRRNIVRTARDESERLNRLVENLLNMTRLEADALYLAFQSGDVEDAIGSALEQLGRRLQDRTISVTIPDTLPLVPMDFVLIVQALVNIVDNALKYSPPDTPVEISARRLDTEVQIQVRDRGVGIPPDDLEHVFDKFYRVHRPDSTTGTGLGLAIAKGIVEAHGGRIWAENHPEGGTVITLTLPAGPEKPRRRTKRTGRKR